MASSDVQILIAGAAAIPLAYEVPNAQEIQPLAVSADFDGSGAAGSFLPTLLIQSDAGLIVARIPVSSAVAAGGSASVTWAPFLRAAQAGNVSYHQYAAAGGYVWQPPSNLVGVYMVVVGAGGAGGGGFLGGGGAYHGGGGGGGGATEFLLMLGAELPGPLNLVVGAGGIGNTNGAAPAPNGTASYIYYGADANRLIVAQPGSGGGTAGSPAAGGLAGAAFGSGPLLGVGGGSGGSAPVGAVGSVGAVAGFGGASGGGGGGGVSAVPGNSFAGGDGGGLTAAAGTLIAGANGGAPIAGAGTPGSVAFMGGGQGGGGGAGNAVANGLGGHGGNGYRGGGGGGSGSGGANATPGGNGGDGFIAIIAMTA